MRPSLIGLFLFMATCMVGQGEARAYDDVAEVNRVICGIPHAEEQALLSPTVADEPTLVARSETSRLCPLASSPIMKCPMNKGESSLIDCCCLKRGGADATPIPLKDSFAGSATLAVAPLSLHHPVAATVYRVVPRTTRYEAIPSPPPERRLSF